MHDAHTHIKKKQEIDYLKANNINCIVNASSKEEYLYLLNSKYQGMCVSCGVHPWYVENTNMEELYPYLLQADFLGEIGLDQPWCQTPFDLQREMFLFQLERINKPTILHTKGYEKEVLDIIRLFPRKYVVHWYSSKDYIDDYIKLDCFFTIGPSVGMDDAVDEVVRKVPLNRLLVETDGLDAVEWAMNKKVEVQEYKQVLIRSIEQIAAIKNMPFDEVKYILDKNFEALTCNS